MFICVFLKRLLQIKEIKSDFHTFSDKNYKMQLIFLKRYEEIREFSVDFYRIENVLAFEEKRLGVLSKT